jgi:tetratricopeptide (TPR) repeat protein
MIDLQRFCRDLGIGKLERAILELATKFHPHDEKLRMTQLLTLALSDDPEERATARAEAASLIGLSWDGQQWIWEEGRVEGRSRMQSPILKSLPLMVLDSLRREREYFKCLKLTEALLQMDPNSSQWLRNHARSLEDMNDYDKAVGFYRASVIADPRDDQAAGWFGTFLSNGLRRVDALEALSAAAVRDPDDGTYFARFANVLGMIVVDGDRQSNPPRELPPELGITQIAEFIRLAASCPNAGNSEEDIRDAAERLSRGGGSLGEEAFAPLPKERRLTAAREIYGLLASSLTQADVTEGGSMH